MSVLQLYQKAIEATSQLRSELQSTKRRVEQLQASKAEMVRIADGYRGIVTKLEPAAHHGRMMAALLEMLLSRTNRLNGCRPNSAAETHH